jgi:hypothetical protein
MDRYSAVRQSTGERGERLGGRWAAESSAGGSPIQARGRSFHASAPAARLRTLSPSKYVTLPVRILVRALRAPDCWRRQEIRLTGAQDFLAGHRA